MCGVCLSAFALFRGCRWCDYGGDGWRGKGRPVVLELMRRGDGDGDGASGIGQRCSSIILWFLVFGFWVFFHTHLWGVLGLLRFMTLSDIVLSVMVSVQT